MLFARLQSFYAIIEIIHSFEKKGSGLQFKQPEPKDFAPIVFVYGLGGWSQSALIDLVFPHWGMMAGSMQKSTTTT